MSMIIRILIVVIAVAAIIGGYFVVKDLAEAKKELEYMKYAGVISEVSLAAELYRENPDSFLVVRDSILDSYGLTIEDILAFQEKMKSARGDWLDVWDKVTQVTDSLADRRLEAMNEQADSMADSPAL
jgi:hypothetical protein